MNVFPNLTKTQTASQFVSQFFTGVEIIEGTADIEPVNARLADLPVGGVAVLLGEFTVGQTPIQLPSDTNVINYGTLKQADNLHGDTVKVLQNATAGPNADDENITFVNYGRIHGNRVNQPDLNGGGRHAVWFKGVDQLRFHGLHVIDPVDFCAKVEQCRNVRFSNFYAEISNVGDHQDGLHFVDSNDVVGHGVSGAPEDDLLAITVDNDAKVSDIAITGVEGSSLDADLVKLNRSIATVGDGTPKVIENVSVTGAVGHDTQAAGVALKPADEDTTYRNITIEATIQDPQTYGLVAGGGATFENCNLNLSVDNPASEGVSLSGVGAFRNSALRVQHRNTATDASAAIVAQNVDSSKISLQSIHRGSAPNMHVLSGDSVDVAVNIDGGGRGVQFGTSTTGVTNSTVRGTCRGVDAQDYIEIPEGGSTANEVWLNGPDREISTDGNTAVRGTGSR